MHQQLKMAASVRRASQSLVFEKLQFKLVCNDSVLFRSLCQQAKLQKNEPMKVNCLNNVEYNVDSMTNVTPRILEYTKRQLHLQQYHPLSLIKRRIVNYINSKYVTRVGNPIFSVFDRLNPVVTLEQNFDSLLVPPGHPSRNKTDSYYLNSEYMLRAHTSAHQRDLIRSGLNAFLVIGDCYRRDEIDSHHYPVFHQLEGVRLFSKEQLFRNQRPDAGWELFDTNSSLRETTRQERHSIEAAKMLEYDLKTTLEGLAKHLFGNEISTRWVETYFPFTHPSFEMEIKQDGVWREILGCGIMEQRILDNAGAGDRVGWAFGLGLERIAMQIYSIGDIRAFWSTDPAFEAQFQTDDPLKRIVYKPISVHPPCTSDMSFWLQNDDFSPNDYYDLVRTIAGDAVQQVIQQDVYKCPKTGRTSHCYRLVYRHMERALTQKEVNVMHEKIAIATGERFGVELRSLATAASTAPSTKRGDNKRKRA